MSRKVIGVFVSLALAALGAFLVISYVNKAEERAIADAEAVEVLVVSDSIAAGERVADVQGKVKSVLVPAKAQALGSVAGLSELDAEYVAAVDLLPGEQVVSARFVPVESIIEESRVDVPADLLQVTVSLLPDRAVGGQLRAGQRVAVVASFEPFAIQAAEPGQGEDAVGSSSFFDVDLVGLKTPNTSHIILHKVLVTAVQIEELPTKTIRDDAEQVGVELAPTGNLLVTLAVSAPDVEKIVFTAEHGMVWLAIEPDGAPEAGTRIQTRGTIYE